MKYIFDTYLASEYGIDEAIVIGMISSLHANKKKLFAPLDVREIDGIPYVGFDEVDFEQLLPFWSYEHCMQTLTNLENKKVLISKTGRKNFYTFSDDFKNWAKEHFKLKH